MGMVGIPMRGLLRKLSSERILLSGVRCIETEIRI